MWKTAVVSVTLAVALTIGIGAGAIRATSDGGSTAPLAQKPAAQVGAGNITDGDLEPPVIRTTSITGQAARPAAKGNAHGDETPPAPSDTSDPEDGTPGRPPDMTGSEDMWRHMEEMHGPEHIDDMREHMDDVHGEGAFESMLDHMGGGMMGGGGVMGGGSGGMMGGGLGSGIAGGGFDGMTSGSSGGGMMGGGMMGGGSGGMMGW